MDADDVYRALHHHWRHDISAFPDERQRIQVSAMILFQSGTASRPRALVYKRLSKTRMKNHYFESGSESDEEENEWILDEYNAEEDDFKTVTYRDIQLSILKGSDGGRDLPVLEVTLRWTKGWIKRMNP